MLTQVSIAYETVMFLTIMMQTPKTINVILSRHQISTYIVDPRPATQRFVFLEGPRQKKKVKGDCE